MSYYLLTEGISESDFSRIADSLAA
jgi:hypothetical protein